MVMNEEPSERQGHEMLCSRILFGVWQSSGYTMDPNENNVLHDPGSGLARSV